MSDVRLSSGNRLVQRRPSRSMLPGLVALAAFSLLLLAFAAFWPKYLSREWAPIDHHTHAHALLGTMWLVILVLQPLFVLRGYRRAHRAVGRVSMPVALAFFVSGVLLAHVRANILSDAAFNEEGMFLYLPLSISVLFGTTCLLGYHWRSSTPVHARFMLSSALLLIDPVVARIMFFHLPPLPSEHLYQGITFGVITALLVALTVSLPPSTRGRVAYRNFCIGAVATLGLYFVIPYTQAWLVLVQWFRALPLS